MSCMHERLSTEKQRRILLCVKTKALSRHLRKAIINRSTCVEYTASVKAASVTAVNAKDNSPSSGDTAWDGHETLLGTA